MNNTLQNAPNHVGFEKFKTIMPEVYNKLQNNTTSEKLKTPIVAGNGFGEEAIVDFVLVYLKKIGAEFADLRLGRDVYRSISVNDTNIQHQNYNESTGIGIRVLYNGFWGFASTYDLSEVGLKKCCEKAIMLARSVSKFTPKELGLKIENFAQEPKHLAVFHTPVAICPLSESTQNIAQPMIESANIALSKQFIKKVSGAIFIKSMRRYFASSEGSRILKTHCVLNAEQKFTAVKDGKSAYRTLVMPGVAGGLEHFILANFPALASEYADEAVQKCDARTLPRGKYNLILDGHNLALTMHESVGHATELDRILGYELSMAGGSFASIDMLNKFKYGSSLVNFTANNSIRFGAASLGFDDEGVEAQKFPIITDGILTGFGNNRETAWKMNSGRSNGCARSTYWSDAPIVRIPNLFMEPGKEKLSLNDLIADTKNGILMLGRDSFSIDQMRNNFQFGADMCYLIENGKIVEPLRDIIYQSTTPKFWNSCDAICDESEWQMHGVINCGKGQPTQIAYMTHGASPSRFHQIDVGF